MTNFNMVSENNESTVVAQYVSDIIHSTEYQSEDALEQSFIQLLVKQGFEYLPITSEADLINNLRSKLEELNNYKFSDREWKLLFNNAIANNNSSIKEKSYSIQEDHIKLIKCDDGLTKNIYLIDKADIFNNQLQIINQYVPEGTPRGNRYDVTILVNGLPLIHVELKRRGVDIKEAFNQINRYQRESFWAGSGLFEYIQIFVISNGTTTKYYSNTTRDAHIKEMANKNSKSKKKTSNSFEFTSYWADAKNRVILDLMDFTKTFFAKQAILNILTKYCIYTNEDILLVMRPYQIVATEQILLRIKTANNLKQFRGVNSGGYIWHTTGSGKTLTSFKTALMASKLDYIDKVLFVVDRKDLDYQTMKEYDRFERGAANSNTSTAVLKRQLENPDTKIIITTIQKLAIFIEKNKDSEVLQKHFVIIFDECHRSQFGDMHLSITKSFKKYHIFGFTGTPIFAVNSSSGGNPKLKTTAQAFGDKLHTYTIIDAIADKNVLPFRVDYIKTMHEKENISEDQVFDINREKALQDPKRISQIVDYIFTHFNQKTKRNDKSFDFKTLLNVEEIAKDKKKQIEEIRQKIRLTGFNSIFAVASIPFAKLYYNEFKKQMLEDITKSLKVAVIFSYGANEEESNGLIDEENPESTTQLDQVSRDFLEGAITDYNEMFKTSYDTSSDKFQNYYKDVSLRMKNREIDLLIVVNMFLTGFDATTLNTLWVDKNLRMHGLLQAYSRTNRILNSIKTFGNIVCFRNLEEATNKSIALFGDSEAQGLVLLRKYDDYYLGYNDGQKDVLGYKDLIEQLLAKFNCSEPIIGEENQKEFIRLYGAILKLKNILSTFDAFSGNEILTERDFQDYHSIYIDLHDQFRKNKSADSETINDDIVFEMELIKQVEINIDYILMLIKKYHASHMTDKDIAVSIQKSINSSVELRNKKDLIENFISSLNADSDIDNDWLRYIQAHQEIELAEIISSENLNDPEARAFIATAFRDGYLQTTGTALVKVLPPVSRFSKDNARTKIRERVINKFTLFFERFKDLVAK